MAPTLVCQREVRKDLNDIELDEMFKRAKRIDELPSSLLQKLKGRGAARNSMSDNMMNKL